MNNHSWLVNASLLWLGQHCPHIRVWKNPTGQAYTFESVHAFIDSMKSLSFSEAMKRLVRISFGLVGAADITGIIAPNGQRLEIEIKTGTGKQSKVQKTYQAMIQAQGGIYIVVRDLKDLEVLLVRAA